MKSLVRILLIDDNPDDRALALRKLEQEFNFIEAQEITNADELDEAIAHGEFDLVITDYRLRWANGLTVLKRIKKHYPDCPVVMFTGTGSEEVAVEAMKSGLDDYIIKSPNHYARLAAAVGASIERAKQRQAFKEVQTLYQRLFEGVPIGLYRILPTGQVLDANPALLHLLGYTNLQALLDTGIAQHSADAEAYRLWQHRLNSEGVLRDFEMPMRHCDGTTIWVRHNARCIRNQAGEILYYEGAIEDVTEHKQVEEERAQLLVREQQARAEAETANRLKDEFLATLSHELRTPLNAILGWAGLLRRQTFSAEKTARALEVIERNAKVQAQLIEDLLDVSRIIRGKLRLTVLPVNLHQVIKAAIDTLQPAAEAKKIRVESFLEPTMATINGDRDRLQQVVWNLLSNAIKFTPMEGSVSIQVKWLDKFVQIQVKDTGKGIPPEIVPYIFERFRQVEGGTTRSEGGLGLGLAIVRHLVELHGGTVWCESSGLDQGTTFTVELPIQTTSSGKKESIRAVFGERSARSKNQLLLANLQILIVEDDSDSVEFLRTVLAQEGAQVIAAQSVREALQFIRQSFPDVLVSDIGLPGEDGYSLIRKIREMEASISKSLPALALTAYARELDRQTALEAGFQDYLSKPVNPDDLVAAILRLLTG